MASSKKPPEASAQRDPVIRALAHPPPEMPPGPILVGYSGGLDSTVLLHALARQIAGGQAWQHFSVQAAHVNHRLQPAAHAMEQHCRSFCALHKIALAVRRPVISAEQKSALGIEAAARQARRAALGMQCRHNKARGIALAHHQDDLVETMLLQWMRGAGLEGLTAMQTLTPSPWGLLWRPLLGCDKKALQAYARKHGLHWIDDPSNEAMYFDRNRLRREVMPVLRSMRPGAVSAMARSVAHLQEARAVLESVTRKDLQLCKAPHADGIDRLSLSALCSMPATRMARTLRAWIAEKGLPMPPARRLEEFCRQLRSAGPESRAQLTVAAAVAGESGGFRVWLRAGFLHLDHSHSAHWPR
ncbi:MAG: tRNA lysidine(34) synthetase TilS [Betaproteobacteria bacterium]|nr:tRNA lysidine(34) synthetase TilS [Betaproteobacteria bacterium]